jgi:hypothetical protein
MIEIVLQRPVLRAKTWVIQTPLTMAQYHLEHPYSLVDLGA